MMLKLLKLAGTWDEMDVLARAQFFEGYLHVPPFKMIRGATGKSQLLKMIDRALHEIGGTPNPEWSSRGDTGLYRATFGAVNKAVRSMRGERAVEAVDLLQTMMGLAGWESDEGEVLELGGKSPFWLAGKHVSVNSPENLTSGKMVPYDAAALTIKLAYRRALDEIRKESDRAKKRQEQQELIVEETMALDDADEDWGEVVDALFANPDSPVSKRFFKWLATQIPNVMRKGEGARVITNYLDLLKAGVVKSDTEAAEALGVSPSGLSNTKKVFTESMAGYLKHNPQAQEAMEGMFSDAKFLHNLLRGRVRGGKVALAQRVAARHLANLAKSAKTLKFKKDVKLKSGEVIPKDAVAKVSYNNSLVADVTVEGMSRPVRLSIRALTVLLDGYPKMPSISRLEKMSDDGIATTPTGKRVEPDGYGPDGSPSWMLIAGVI